MIALLQQKGNKSEKNLLHEYLVHKSLEYKPSSLKINLKNQGSTLDREDRLCLHICNFQTLAFQIHVED